MDTRIIDSHPASARLEMLGIKYLFKPVATSNSTRGHDSGRPDTGRNLQSKTQEPACIQPDSFLEPMYRPCYSVWTYIELYDDLCSGFNTPRAKLLSAIQNSLGWDPYSFTFWPVSRKLSGQVLPDMNFFYSAMDRINPVYIFCFGASAFNILLPEEKYSYGKWRVGRFSILALPALEALMPDNRLLKNFTWNILNKFSLL